MKLVVLDGYTLNPGDIGWDKLEKFGNLTVYDRTNTGEVLDRIRDADIVFTNKTYVSREAIYSAPNLKYIGVLATGYNSVDIQAAKERNIPVTNVPSYGTEAVAQFAIGLLLEVCHQIGHHNRVVHEGKWEACPDYCFWDYPMIELSGKTMGIIGLGRIGTCTGRIAKAMGMNVITSTKELSPEGEKIARRVSLDELLKDSDVIMLHCPLTPETREMINKETIGKMKDGVILVNNSRGQLIAEQDLADALNSGKIYFAAVDVISEEPIKSENPLLKAKNCIITPHISWTPKESRMRLISIASENLEQFLSGHPVNVVNG